MPPCLDHHALPHLFDRVFDYADAVALRTLRTACRMLRERVDSTLYRHIVIETVFSPSPPSPSITSAADSSNGSSAKTEQVTALTSDNGQLVLRHPSGPRLPAHPDVFTHSPTLQLINFLPRIMSLDVLDFKYPFSGGGDSPALVSLLHVRNPRVVRLCIGPQARLWYPHSTFHGELWASETAVYFTHHISPFPSGHEGHPTAVCNLHAFANLPFDFQIFPVFASVVKGARRQVLNWSFDPENAQHIKSLFLIVIELKTRPEAHEFVLILGDNYGLIESSRIYRLTKGVLIWACSGMVEFPLASFTVVGAESWYSPSFRNQMATIIDAKDEPRIELLTRQQYHARVGCTQYRLETFSPALGPLPPFCVGVDEV